MPFCSISLEGTINREKRKILIYSAQKWLNILGAPISFSTTVQMSRKDGTRLNEYMGHGHDTLVFFC